MNNSSAKTKQDLIDAYSDEAQKNARLAKDWYDKIATNVDKCPFCDLKEKYVVIDGEFSVLTMNLFPYIDGHMMVIPKRHIEKVDEIDSKEWHEMQELTSAGIRLIAEVLNTADVNVFFRQGTETSGSSLKHFHSHILPITKEFLKYREGGFNWEFQKIEFSPREMAQKFKNHLNGK